MEGEEEEEEGEGEEEEEGEEGEGGKEEKEKGGGGGGGGRKEEREEELKTVYICLAPGNGSLVPRPIFRTGLGMRLLEMVTVFKQQCLIP